MLRPENKLCKTNSIKNGNELKPQPTENGLNPFYSNIMKRISMTDLNRVNDSNWEVSSCLVFEQLKSTSGLCV